jgi:type IV pilus assembly protein PilA
MGPLGTRARKTFIGYHLSRRKQVLETLSKRLGRDKDEEGFTLIELMVVVLIIAILIAIAIPTFLGARTRAQDRQAQSNLRNAFAAEKVVYTDDQAYTATPASLTAIEPSLSYVAGTGVTAAANPKTVYVDVTGTTLIIGAKSKSGKCFYMKDSSNAPTTYAEDSGCAALTAGTLTFNSEW